MRTLTTLFLVAFAGLTGCSSPGGPPLHKMAAEINATLYEGLDRISPGDEIEVRFTYAAEYNQTVSVQRDGNASFVAVGPILSAGLLPSELDDELTRRYATVLGESRSPDLVVALTEQAPRSIYVLGEVGEPGPYVLDEDGKVTLLEALALAGGHSKSTAWVSNTLLVRYDPESRTQRSWKFDARPRHWGNAETILLQEHDVLFIPNTNIDDVGIFIDMWIRRLIPWPYLFIPQ